jgi:hypothetical protein
MQEDYKPFGHLKDIEAIELIQLVREQNILIDSITEKLKDLKEILKQNYYCLRKIRHLITTNKSDTQIVQQIKELLEQNS